jgi:integrase
MAHGGWIRPEISEVSAATPLAFETRFAHLCALAREFGTVAADRRAGRETVYYLRFVVDGETHTIRRVPVGSSWIRIGTKRDLADEILGEIRADLRRSGNPIQAISAYLGEDADAVSFLRHWGAFVDWNRTRVIQEQIGQQRVTDFEKWTRCGYLDPLMPCSIHTITYRVLEDWQTWLFEDGRLGPKSIRMLIADVVTCLNWLARRGDLPIAPKSPTTRVPEYVPTIPSPTQQEAMLGAIPWPVAGFFLARGFMGLRDEEATRANLGDYHWHEPDKRGACRDQLTVRGKGKRGRIVPVDADLARWVREHHDPRSLAAWPGMADLPLFPNPNARSAEKRWTPASRRRVMLAAMKSVDVHTTPNEALRHCYGTRVANRLLREGSGEGDASRKIMQMMGHTSVTTSQRYVKLAAETLRGLVRRDDD